MKKLINSLIIVLLCTVSVYGKEKDPYHLILQGEFLNQKNVDYTVFKMNDQGDFVAEYTGKSRKYYSITCDVGSRYLIQFIDQNLNIKFLMVNVSRSGVFAIDVDFSKKQDAQLIFTRTGYKIELLPDNPLVKN